MSETGGEEKGQRRGRGGSFRGGGSRGRGGRGRGGGMSRGGARGSFRGGSRRGWKVGESPNPDSENKNNSEHKEGSYQNRKRKSRHLHRVCLGCRKKGHSLKDCPERFNSDQQKKCYNCGKTDHTTRACPEPPKDGGFSFATCFICKQTGHLASQCSQNEGKGVYIRGGHCHKCGSVEHYAKNCPKKDAKPTSKGDPTKEGIPDVPGINDDEEEQKEQKEEATPKKKRKVVKF
jgi:zinc finger CCHC domain-containing protein 9